MSKSKTCAESPCPSCPYRKDTPKGVWAQDHYEMLPQYDGDIGEQVTKGAFAPFGCHYDNGNLCRGWIDCHGAENLLSLRLAEVSDEMFTPPKADVYASGAEVLKANLPHMENPSPEARAMMDNLIKIPGKKNVEGD